VAAFLVSTNYDFGLGWKYVFVGWRSGLIAITLAEPRPQLPPTPLSLSWKPTSRAIRWRPSMLRGKQVTIVFIPLWIPTMIALAAAWFFQRKARVPPPGHCKKCGYNLCGNLSGVCPECGTAKSPVSSS
jgi:hypothetical protein